MSEATAKRCGLTRTTASVRPSPRSPPVAPKPFFFPQLTVHAGVLGGSTGGSSTSVAATKTTKSASTMSTMTRGNGISTPQPTMPGMTAKCDKFYKVQKGEGCWDVTDKNDISQADFYAWNTGVGLTVKRCGLMRMSASMVSTRTGGTGGNPGILTVVLGHDSRGTSVVRSMYS